MMAFTTTPRQARSSAGPDSFAAVLMAAGGRLDQSLHQLAGTRNLVISGPLSHRQSGK